MTFYITCTCMVATIYSIFELLKVCFNYKFYHTSSQDLSSLPVNSMFLVDCYISGLSENL